jgi:hypothetical protein
MMLGCSKKGFDPSPSKKSSCISIDQEYEVENMPSSHGAKTRQKMKKGSQRKQEKDHMNCWGTRLQQQTLTRLVDRRCNKKNISILDNPQTDLKNMRHLSNYFAVYVAFSSF